ncbi:MAG: hypothetical protein J6B87_00695 [Clostridia bacterium]|nr:hypothetical protein [Clostridia bacterium]
MIRCLSDEGINVGLVDERSEIAAMYRGIPQNDIGKRTDVMNNCLKHIGMRMMIRSMSPQLIATDEIGGENDERAIEEAGYAGVKLLLTAHGEHIKDISKSLLEKRIFKNIIVLGKSIQPGFIKNIYSLEEDKYVVRY